MTTNSTYQHHAITSRRREGRNREIGYVVKFVVQGEFHVSFCNHDSNLIFVLVYTSHTCIS